MLIDQQLKKRIWRLLLSATTPAIDQRLADRDVNDDSLPRLTRRSVAQSAISTLADAPSWMSPSLVLTTARAASGL